MEKKRNLWVIPTDKPSRLYFWKNKLRIGDLTTAPINLGISNQNIYITNSEEIKEGDWYCHNQINYLRVSNSNAIPMDSEKIILTTDPQLIADGVQPIDDEFLEWFVKNPSCEEVEIDKGYRGVDLFNYKIIIPSENKLLNTQDFGLPQIGTKEFNNLASAYFGGKPKQYLEKEMFDLEQELDILSNLRWHNSKPKQETLEEAAEVYSKRSSASVFQENHKKDFINGAKWQQERMYSEEEVLKILLAKNVDLGIIGKTSEVKEWFEQFKNK